MLIDIYEAMDSEVSEYYLQYITVKKNTKPSKALLTSMTPVLEVIDGQQRLTTLSIFFYRLESRRPGNNIAKGLLQYARYYTANKNVDQFEQVCQFANDPAFKSGNSQTQDVFYMVSAARCIDQFLDILTKESRLDDFLAFLLNHVMLIVNIESEHVDSEDTFANLNDNKVDLTDSYLVKGLLLTMAVQRENTHGARRNYREILDQRSIMGRVWDEIMSWISNEDVAHFFFGQSKRNRGMESLLDYVFHLKYGNKGNTGKNNVIIDLFVKRLATAGPSLTTTDKFPIFNRFNERVRDTKEALDVLQSIKHVYHKLRGVYDNYSDSTLFNLLGFVLFSDNITNNNGPVKQDEEQFRIGMLDKLVNSGSGEFKKDLKQTALELIPSMNDKISAYRQTNKIDIDVELTDEQTEEALKAFKYKSSNPELRNLLLSFSVFPEVPNAAYRFDFCQYDLHNWSFEHIFPQHPTGTLKIDRIAISTVCKAIDEVIAKTQDPNKKTRLQEIKNQINDRKRLDKDAIDSIGFLYECDFDIHQCGNMALLSDGVNSALSNNPYIAKRLIIMDKAISEFFVPQHTMAVFNKSLSVTDQRSFTPELSRWDGSDVTAHMHWQIKRNEQIRADLKK